MVLSVFLADTVLVVSQTTTERIDMKQLYIYDKTTQGTAGNLRTVIRGTESYCLEQAEKNYPNCLWAWFKG